MDLENFDQQLKKQDPYGRWVNANRHLDRSVLGEYKEDNLSA